MLGISPGTKRYKGEEERQTRGKKKSQKMLNSSLDTTSLAFSYFYPHP